MTGAENAPESTVDVAVSKDCQSRVRAVLSIIYLNVEPDFRRIIKNIHDPAAAWTKLKTHFQSDNRSKHMQLFSELLACRIRSEELKDMYVA